MPDGSNVILLYDGTFEGLMTAVFDSYSCHPAPEGVAQAQQCQQLLGREYRDVITDDEKADRVIAGVRRAMGADAYEKVWRAFLSCDDGKGDAIYRYIRLGMRIGRRILLRLTDDRVMRLEGIDRLVGREAGLLIEFVRFSEMEGGIYYGEITPENDVLPLIMPHFAERFHIQPFILHDKGRRQAGVFDTREWVLTSTEGMRLPDYARGEQEYRRMWKAFYNTIAIKELINPALRRNHMPKKYWKNMLEMQPDLHPGDVEERSAYPLPSECRGQGGRLGGQTQADPARFLPDGEDVKLNQTARYPAQLPSARKG